MLIWRTTHMCSGWTEVVCDDSKKSMKREVSYNTCCYVVSLCPTGDGDDYWSTSIWWFFHSRTCVRYIFSFEVCFSFYRNLHHEFVLIVESDIVRLRGIFCIRTKKFVINATRSCSDYRRRSMILRILLTKLSTLKRCTGCNKIISTITLSEVT